MTEDENKSDITDEEIEIAPRHNIQSGSVRAQIQGLESLIEERTNAIIDAQNAISKADNDIQLAHDMITYLRNNYRLDNHDPRKSMTRKKYMILTVIAETTIPKGILIPEIKGIIKDKHQVSLSLTTIHQKIHELTKESYVYQVNDGQLRSKRYLARK